MEVFAKDQREKLEKEYGVELGGALALILWTRRKRRYLNEDLLLRTKLVENTIRNKINEVRINQNRTDDDIIKFVASEARSNLLSSHEVLTASEIAKNIIADISGLKPNKVWITKDDERVRSTHENINNKEIGFDELFTVGGSQMRFPRDTMYGAHLKERIECRCEVEYKKAR